MVDSSTQIVQSCSAHRKAANNQNRFTIVGRGELMDVNLQETSNHLGKAP
jgi:hypothetical protein